MVLEWGFPGQLLKTLSLFLGKYNYNYSQVLPIALFNLGILFFVVID